MRPSPIVPLLLGLAATVAHGQQTARLVKYHTNDIVNVRAKMRYTTLIELPSTEKILEVATGDKDFWIIDTVGNYCFLHPAKEGTHSNLNLITDKGSVYSFMLDDVESGDPDLKVVIQPSDPSSLTAANGAGKLVSASEVDAARAQAQLAQNHAAAAVEQFRADYPTQALQFDYSFRNKSPFDVTAIYHDDKFTYIKSSAAEKFSIYELKDGKPDLITFQLKDGTYVIPTVVDNTTTREMAPASGHRTSAGPPIVGQMMHPYMRRRQGKEEVTYPHPSLKPVLERTLGVPLFQEQLLRIAMTVADFSGAEADELRRAVGMRRSWERMKNLEGKLRAGMTRKGIDTRTQDTIVQHISSFALYGFPESHAASFALIAYASAYFKVKYLAAFTTAILNNQPMGFYSAAVLVKDAQRHGLRVKPIDVQVSEWPCTIEHESDGTLSLRIGLGYAKRLTKESAEALVRSRRQNGPFRSPEDLAQRVPSLNRRELTRLAQIGALNQLDGIQHRRDALWQVERAGKLEGPLLRDSESLREDSEARPLEQMNVEERLLADYAGTGLTAGKHPMHYRRAELCRSNILSAQDLRLRRDGEYVRVAGCVIARQRPGTAKGFIFISMEAEKGIANVIVTPDLYDCDRLVVTRSKFLLVEGPLQNQDNVIHVKAMRLTTLSDHALEVRSHDFH